MSFVPGTWRAGMGLGPGAVPEDDEHRDERAPVFDDGRWRWEPIPAPAPGPRTHIAIVDGIRREEGFGAETGSGSPRDAMFGSWAVGAVALGPGYCSILRDRIRAGGVYAVAGDGGRDQDVRFADGARPRVYEHAAARGSGRGSLVGVLQQRMLVEEYALLGELIDELPRETLVIHDGDLRRGAAGVGFVKNGNPGILPDGRAAILDSIGSPGERTPPFLLGTGRNAVLAWYLCLSRHPRRLPRARLVRMEIAASAGPEEAERVAAICARDLPPLAPDPWRDARAPQNLQPVAALEDALRQRLGSGAWMGRRIELAARDRRESAAPRPSEDAA